MSNNIIKKWKKRIISHQANNKRTLKNNILIFFRKNEILPLKINTISIFIPIRLLQNLIFIAIIWISFIASHIKNILANISFQIFKNNIINCLRLFNNFSINPKQFINFNSKRITKLLNDLLLRIVYFILR